MHLAQVTTIQFKGNGPMMYTDTRINMKQIWMVAALSLLVCQEVFAEHEKWNIISIVTDDQADWAVGAYGNREIVTPNMDRLAREGARFTQAFAASGVCTPSRVAFLTGLYPTQVGVTDVPYLRDPDDGLPRTVPTWPRVLQQHGYVTGLIGKWHLGRTMEHYPTNYGLDYFFGFLRGANLPMNPVLSRDGEISVVPGPTPDILMDDAMRFIERHQSHPFALMIHFRAPHAPHLPVPEWTASGGLRIQWISEDT